MTIGDRLDRWIFTEYATDPEDLAVYRILVGLFIGAIYVPSALWTAAIPDVFLDPPLGPTAFFTEGPERWTLFALNAVLVVGLAGLITGWHTTASSIAVGLTLIALQSWEFSYSKINAEILICLLPLTLAASSWGSAYSVDARRRPDPGAPTTGWPLALLALVVGLAMLSAGWAKLSSGWLSLDSQATLGHLTSVYYRSLGRQPLLAEFAMATESVFLWELADWATVALEVGVVLTIVRRGLFLASLAALSIFHFGVLLLFDISFGINIVVYGAFLPWARILRRIAPSGRSARIGARAASVHPGVWIGSCVAIMAIPVTLGEPLDRVLRLPVSQAVVTAGFLLAVGWLLSEVVRLASR